MAGALCTAVVGAHTGLDMDHMAPAEMVAICLAVTETAAVVVALAAMAAVCPVLAAPSVRLATAPPARPFAPPARAGPARLQVFRL